MYLPFPLVIIIIHQKPLSYTDIRVLLLLLITKQNTILQTKQNNNMHSLWSCKHRKYVTQILILISLFGHLDSGFVQCVCGILPTESIQPYQFLLKICLKFCFFFKKKTNQIYAFFFLWKSFGKNMMHVWILCLCVYTLQPPSS